MVVTSAFDLREDAIRPVLDPRVFVQARDGGVESENQRQATFVGMMRLHAHAVIVFAVPNGTFIASRAGRAKVKREGLYAGFPDTGAAWSDKTAYLEWKNGKEGPRDAQIECLNRLVEMGHPCAVVRTAEVAMRWLRDTCGAPVPEVR